MFWYLPPVSEYYEMALTDTLFLFLFLPVSLITCLLGVRAQKYFLLILSLAFYACGSPGCFVMFVLMLAVDVALAYGIRFAGIRSEEQKSRTGKILLIIGVVINAGALFYYKYYDFVLSSLNQVFRTEFPARNLLLPLGISFFTFKAISLLADVYKGEVDLPKDPVLPALYLSFFGQVLSGPITCYNEFYKNYRPNLLDRKKAFARIRSGSLLFVRGFAKKILLADVLGKIASEVFSGTQAPSAAYLWLGSICYTLQLYYDFSGYSEMAIGVGRFFGIHSEPNFRYPYLTASVSEFWRRWHISLGTWFRKYVYFPLGGSRVDSKKRLFFNLFAVWALTGIWHGANWTFIVWGLFYFAAIAAEKALDLPGRFKTAPVRALYRIPVLLFINFQWVLFNSSGIKEGFAYIGGMFTAKNALTDVRAGVLFGQYKVFIIAGILLTLPVVPMLKKVLLRLPEKGRIAAEIAMAGALAVLFVIAVSFVIAGNNDPFLYGNF